MLNDFGLCFGINDSTVSLFFFTVLETEVEVEREYPPTSSLVMMISEVNLVKTKELIKRN